MTDSLTAPLSRPRRGRDQARAVPAADVLNPDPPVQPLGLGRFAPPSPRVDSIERTDLIATLQAWPDHRVTLLEGPAGYGKSTVLGQVWRNLDAGRVVRPWLTLEAADRSLGRFLQDLAEALRIAGVTAPDWCGIAEEDAARLVDALRAAAKPVWLALDNYHAAQSPELDAFIAMLIAHSDASVHVAIAARSRPCIRLAALAERHALIDVKADALAFTSAETRTLCGGRLSADGVEALYIKTEGWPAALQLARRRLSEGATSARVLAAVQGGVGELRDYIAEEVFDPLPQAAQMFLIETMGLDTLDAASADAARGRADSAALLADLERRNTLMFPTGADGSAFRIHTLLSEFLQAQFVRLPPAQRQEMEERTTAYFASSGQLECALAHARRLNETRPPLSRMETAPASAFWRVDRLIDFGASFIGASDHAFDEAPRALALRALGWFGAGRTLQAREDAEKAALALAKRISSADPARAWEAEREVEAWNGLRTALFEDAVSGDQPNSIIIAQDGGDQAGLDGVLTHAAAVLALRAGRSDSARAIAQTWAEKKRTPGDPEAFFAFTQLGFLLLQDAAPRLALAALEEAARLDPKRPEADRLRQAWRVCRACVALELGEAFDVWPLPTPEAAPLLLGLSQELLVESASLSARAVLREEGYAAAQGLLDRARATAMERGWTNAADALAAEAVTLAVRARAPAAKLTKRLAGQSSNAPRIELALARSELANNAPGAARARLKALLSTPHLAGRWRIVARNLDAYAAEADGATFDIAAGLDAMLQMSKAGAMCASFFDDADHVFGELVALGARLAAVNIDDPRIEAIVDLVVARPRFVGEERLQPPSAAEQVMVASFRKTGARAEVARVLDMSENTLKTHLRRVFQKWSVNDWRIAVKVAERLAPPGTDKAEKLSR